MSPSRIISSFIIIYSLYYTRSIAAKVSDHLCEKDSLTWTCPDKANCGQVYETCTFNDNKKKRLGHDEILIMIWLIVTVVIIAFTAGCCYYLKWSKQRLRHLSERMSNNLAIESEPSPIFRVSLNSPHKTEISIGKSSNV